MKTAAQLDPNPQSERDPCHVLPPILPHDLRPIQEAAERMAEVRQDIAEQLGRDRSKPPSFLKTFRAVAETPPERKSEPQWSLSVIAAYLRAFPDAMFAELRGKGLAAFQPMAGPVLVVSGDGVREAFLKHALLTVDFYGTEMKHVLHSTPPDGSDRTYHFILGTDDDRDYVGDREILNEAVNADDPKDIQDALTRFCHQQVKAAVDAQREANTPAGEPLKLDVVQTLARAVPMFLVETYMGLPLEQDSPKGFLLSDAMLIRYGGNIDEELSCTGLGRRDGIRPNAEIMYCWIKTAYQCFFNNVTRDINVRREGLRNARLLLCFIQQVIEERKQMLQNGAEVAPLGETPGPGQVPDGLLTRLLRKHLANPRERRRHTELRISENLLGVTLGIMVGLEEAIGRVVESLFKLKAGGHYDPSSNPAQAGSFADAAVSALAAHASVTTPPEQIQIRRDLTLYFRECLRLEPQAEALIRRCAVDGATLFDAPRGTPDADVAEYAGDKPLARGTLVFVAHRSAMRDIEAAGEFRLDRSHPEQPDDPDAQDLIHLYQGYGRHKCLGQYMAPAATVEALIALLPLDDLEPARSFEQGLLELGKNGLYAVSLPVTFRDDRNTQTVYPPET